jgi:hypothetical protein
VGGSIENYGKLYVSGIINGNIINFDNGTTTIEGIVDGELFGGNLDPLYLSELLQIPIDAQITKGKLKF